MKTIYLKYALSIAFLCMAFIACEDAVEMESKYKEDYIHSNKTPEYYQALREYKKSDHAISFGWFGNWSGVGSSLANSMAGLPDSVDVISIWGNWRNPSIQQKTDLKYVQEVKGTKAMMCFIIQNVGDQLTPAEYQDDYKVYWGWKDDDPEAIVSAVKKYANAICDTIDRYGYDGFDIDYEPNYGHRGNMSGSDANMLLFIQTLRERLGTKKETGKIIALDGEPQTIVSEAGPLIDYFIVQAYKSTDYTDLDRRLQSTINNFAGILTPEEVAKKYVVTENFESYSAKGGVSHTTRDGKVVNSLKGMAMWNPILNGKTVRKGGIGTFHMEYEFTIPGLSGTYPYLRSGIQIMNPNVE